MKFSIIVPSLYARPQWWEECAMSVVKQDYPDWEMLVSTDADMPLFDGRMKLVRGQNHSIPRALNLALAAATGDVFLWLNDDDFLLPRALTLVNAEIGDSMWCYGSMLYHNSTYGSYDLWSLRNVGNSMPIISTFWTRKAYEVVGGFNESFRFACDYEYWLRLGVKWAPKAIWRVLAYYREHPGMVTHEYGGEVGVEADRIKAMYADKG